MARTGSRRWHAKEGNIAGNDGARNRSMHVRHRQVDQLLFSASCGSYECNRRTKRMQRVPTLESSRVYTRSRYRREYWAENGLMSGTLRGMPFSLCAHDSKRCQKKICATTQLEFSPPINEFMTAKSHSMMKLEVGQLWSNESMRGFEAQEGQPNNAFFFCYQTSFSCISVLYTCYESCRLISYIPIPCWFSELLQRYKYVNRFRMIATVFRI